MPFDWTAFIDLAADFESQAASAANPEALQRTAVGRAYYGAFGYALDHAVDFLGYKPKSRREDDHGGLRDHLKSKRRRNAAERLDQLRRSRNTADYSGKLDWQDIGVTVASAIAKAKEVLAILPPPKPSRP
jgi:hypothetical protein